MILKLIDKKKEVGNVKTFVFKSQKSIKWIAGQYLIYSLDHKRKDLRGKMRFFTISSAPYEKKPQITTRIFEKPSSFKKSLDSLKLGDKINAKGPDGSFVVKDFNKEYVFIAGGIGITPFHSILKQLDFESKKIKVILFYSSKKKILFKDELIKFSERNKQLKINFLDKGVDFYFLKENLRKLKDKIIFVSGPDPMVEEVENSLKKLKIPKERIVSDYFSGYKS